jgi:hypothetical protein
VSALDFAVLAFVAWQVSSDLYNSGYKEAQNLLFDIVTLSIMPYMVGKSLIEPAGLRTVFARRFVWLLFLVSLISAIEFRFGVNPFKLLISYFFPDQQAGWILQTRWGFGRTAGPYGHAILMGGVATIAFLICRWLANARQWEPQFKWLSARPFSKSQVLTVGVAAGLGMTLSRGPWIGALCGIVLFSLGANFNRRIVRNRVLLMLLAAAGLMYYAGSSYLALTSVKYKYKYTSEESSSVAYRAELIKQYTNIVEERPIAGWGRSKWPEVHGMSSIDNHYMLLALGSGFVGVGLFVLMLGIAAWRLFAGGFFPQRLDPADRSFRFTMLGVIIAIAICVASVYLGLQLQPLLFLFLGWSEACLVTRPRAVAINPIMVLA